MTSASWLAQITQAFSTPFKWWAIIAPWEQGLRIRGGKRAKRLNAGVHFRIPYWDRVYVQATRLRTVTATGMTMTTADGHVLTISMAVEFAIRDIEAVYGRLSNPDGMVIYRVQHAITEFIARKQRAELTPDKMAASVMLDDVPWDEWGLEQPAFRLTGFAFVRTYRLINNEYQSMSGLDVDSPDARR